MQQTLFHTCGARVDVNEVIEGRSNRFVFLDALTGDGLDRCPRCSRELHIHAFRPQAPLPKLSRAKAARPAGAKREARRLIAKARRIRTQRSAA
ncbi:MAG TPA: hypothetical protein VHE37_12070 [Nevskiaceae bacterium]|nr:hypothetical protein [Nevskiaceae bacterium]